MVFIVYVFIFLDFVIETWVVNYLACVLLTGRNNLHIVFDAL